MKKRILFLALTLAAMVAVFALTASAATSGYYSYTVSNGEVAIAYVDTSISGDITIPSTLGGCPVTSIGEYAFNSCERLTSVTIPEGVTSIGHGAFLRCYKLTNVTLPKGVTSIGDSAFSYCDKLTNVTFSEGILSIGAHAFNCCYELTGVTIPEGVTSIGSHAFDSCSSLTSMTIPSSVTTIGEYAFSGCSSLTSFAVDTQNAYYSHDAYGVLFNKTKTELIQYPCANTGTIYAIPSSVTTIVGSAFEECGKLTYVTIPDGVTSIGNFAFRSCRSLTSVTIPSSVTSIGSGAFAYSNNLTIYGYRGTTAETYASNNSVPFIALDTAIAPPVIVLQPVSAAYVVGDTAIPLSVAATGNTISYQWYEAASLSNSGGTAIPGATSATYTPSTAAVGVRYYYAVVTNSNPDLPAGTEKTLASDPVAVTVEKPTKFTLTGRVLSYGGATDALTVELLEGSSVVCSTTVTGIDAVFTLTDVLDGTYTLRVRKALHLDYTLTGLVVGDSDIDLRQHADPNIAVIALPCGDLNGDGVINVADVALLRMAANYGKSTDDLVFSFGG